MPIEFAPNLDIDHYYAEAEQMEVVGIACRRFLSELCPSYRDTPWPGKTTTTREARLEALARSDLFKHLQRGLRVSVHFVNPYSDYANQRAQEEKLVNASCRADIHRGVDALRCLADDLREAPREYAISGRLDVYLLRTNPYVNYTLIRTHGRPTVLRVGFLLMERTGVTSPRLQITEEPETVAVFQSHVTQVGGDPLFQWRDTSVTFHADFKMHGGHNAFLCYNRQDSVLMLQLKDALYARGLTCWFDREIPGGAEWERRIRVCIAQSRCAVVLLSKSGPGYYQVREIEMLLQRKGDVPEDMPPFTIIPVSLNGGNYANTPLTRFNIVDLSSDNWDGVAMIARSIRDANGF